MSLPCNESAKTSGSPPASVWSTYTGAANVGPVEPALLEPGSKPAATTSPNAAASASGRSETIEFLLVGLGPVPGAGENYADAMTEPTTTTWPACAESPAAECRTPRQRGMSAEEGCQLCAFAGGERLFERGERRLEVGGPAGADDDCGDARLAEQPAERKRRGIAHLLQPFERSEDSVGAKVLVRLRALRHARSPRRRLAALVLPGQPAARQRAERREAEAMLGAERQHLVLRLAIEQRVRVLHPGERTGSERVAQLRAVDVAEPVGVDLAHGDELVEDARDLGDRHVVVPGVGEIHVDALGAEPAQAALQLATHARGREAAVLSLGHRAEGLRGENRVVPRAPPPSADVRLAPAAAVRVGGVEARDPRLPGRVHQGEGLVLVQPLAEERGSRADAAEVAASEDQPRVGSLHERDATRRGGSAQTVLVAAGRFRVPRRAGWVAGPRRGRRGDRGGAARRERQPRRAVRDRAPRRGDRRHRAR